MDDQEEAFDRETDPEEDQDGEGDRTPVKGRTMTWRSWSRRWIRPLTLQKILLATYVDSAKAVQEVVAETIATRAGPGPEQAYVETVTAAFSEWS